mmetsp:Transcript_20661/g.67645  ORF Transcript_20661/g.67645 Transcript_20661/m.67645 type:complete len:316 (-) Transcript_20661:76-1023(-)
MGVRSRGQAAARVATGAARADSRAPPRQPVRPRRGLVVVLHPLCLERRAALDTVAAARRSRPAATLCRVALQRQLCAALRRGRRGRRGVSAAAAAPHRRGRSQGRLRRLVDCASPRRAVAGLGTGPSGRGEHRGQLRRGRCPAPGPGPAAYERRAPPRPRREERRRRGSRCRGAAACRVWRSAAESGPRPGVLRPASPRNRARPPRGPRPRSVSARGAALPRARRLRLAAPPARLGALAALAGRRRRRRGEPGRDRRAPPPSGPPRRCRRRRARRQAAPEPEAAAAPAQRDGWRCGLAVISRGTCARACASVGGV